jgi:Tfp pilus assembly protein PilF
MNRQLPFVLIINILVCANISAQSSDKAPLRVGTTFPVEVQVADSAAAQLRYCTRLEAKIGAATDDAARYAAVAQVLANLRVIPERWPNDTAAVIAAYQLQADVSLEANMPRNAVEFLESASPLAKNSDSEPAIEKSLAEAFDMQGDAQSAEAHFQRAVSTAHARRITPDQETDILQGYAFLLARTGRPEEAAKQFRAAANLPRQSPTREAVLLLTSAQHANRARTATGKASARQDLDALTKQLIDAKANAKSGVEIAQLYAIEQDAARLRAELDKHQGGA